MKKWFWWLVLNGGFAGSVWFGFVEGVQGAQYLAKFWIWAVAVPVGLVMFTDVMQQKLAEKLAEERPRPARAFAQRIISWGALGVLIWYGHIVTATAWAFCMLAAYICRQGVKKRRFEVASQSGACGTVNG